MSGCEIGDRTRVGPLLAVLIWAGCAAAPTQADSETETTSEGSSSTIATEESSSTAPEPMLWDPDRDALFFAAGSNAANAAWLSSGFVVLDRTGATLFDEDGDSVSSFLADRPVYSGTFDRDRMVLGDSARFTVLDANLVEVSAGELVEPCITGVVFGDLYVCASSRESGQVYTSYDLETGGFVANSEEYTETHTPMQRIPGRSEFITLPAKLSSGQYKLFSRVGDSVQRLGASPHHGDFWMDAHYAFLGDPAAHLVAVGGEILRIHADGGGCESTTSVIPGENCLVREGALGHLPPGVQRYLDVQTGRDGTIFGLYSRDENPLSGHPCSDEPCVLQEIEPDTRTLLRERDITTGENRHHYLYPHPDGRGVAVVVSEDDRWSASDREASSGSWEAYYAGL